MAGLSWERPFEKILLQHGWEKVSNWDCLFEQRQKGLFLTVYVDDIKLTGKKHNIDPMWKVLNTEVDLGEPKSFLDHVYLVVLKDIVKLAKILWTIREPCVNLEFPWEGQKNFHTLRIFVFLHGLVIWKVMKKECGKILRVSKQDEATTLRSI